jgi:hypothetical protein
MKTIIVFVLFLQLLNAQKVTTYEDVFAFLESNGIVVGRDVSHDDLYSYLQEGSINTKTGIDLDSLYKKIIENQDKIDSSVEQEENLKEEYNLNNERPTDKEVLKYLKDKNDILSEAKEKRADSQNVDKNKSWFSQRLDDILEKIKF